MFIIDQATENDIPAIRELAEKTWWPTYSPILAPEQIRYMLDTIYDADAIRKDISSGAQIFLILHDEHGHQAFASYSTREDNPPIAKLHKLYVLPTARDRGYGRALIRYVTAALLERNIHALELNVNRYNPARTFYEKTGFKIIREEDIPIGPYWMNDYVMRMDF